MNTLSSSAPGVRGRASWHGFQAVMDTHNHRAAAAGTPGMIVNVFAQQ